MRNDDLGAEIEIIDKWIKNYIRTFYTDDEDVQWGIRTKEEHTARVRAISAELANHLSLNSHDVLLAEMIGLLHDIGRFRQFTLYRTFNDAQSEDHAALGIKIIADEGLTDALRTDERAIVNFAISSHNKKKIPATSDERALMFARIIRDADKLDIYHVLEPFITPPDGSGASPDFLERFVRGDQCDYTMIRTPDDRKLVRLMWVYDVNFSWTLQKMMTRGYIERIINSLPDDPKISDGVRRLREYMKNKCAEKDIIQ